MRGIAHVTLSLVQARILQNLITPANSLPGMAHAAPVWSLFDDVRPKLDHLFGLGKLIFADLLHDQHTMRQARPTKQERCAVEEAPPNDVKPQGCSSGEAQAAHTHLCKDRALTAEPMAGDLQPGSTTTEDQISGFTLALSELSVLPLNVQLESTATVGINTTTNDEEEEVTNGKLSTY